jgi:allantoin racemase
MRIKYIITTPIAPSTAVRMSQFPAGLLGPGVELEFVHVKNGATVVDCYYEDLIFEMYIVEAGLRSEEEGYDAVIMDTASDSGMYALRSRLTIPAIGPGLVSYCVASMLGRRFSILLMWDKWMHFHEKNLDSYGLSGKCASIRHAGIAPNMQLLLTGREGAVVERLAEVARDAITSDGADAIILGSTTMHQAAAPLGELLPVPVISPGPVAVKMTEALVALGLSHSKVAFPSPSTLQDEKFHSLMAAGAGGG